MVDITIKEIKHNESSLQYYISPWDTDNFGYKVVNIMRFKKGNNRVGDLQTILEEFESFIRKENIRVIVWKVNSLDVELISFLQTQKYHYIEMSIVPYINPMNIDEEKYRMYCTCFVRKAVAQDIVCLKSIAKHAFKNDRFHKDANFNNEKADEKIFIMGRK